MTVRVLALASGVTDLTGHRYHESAGFTQAGVGNARSGIIPTSGAADVSQVSTMVVSVAGFAAWIDGTASANQAGYNFVSDAATQITIADGEASVARTDRIWAVVHHDVFDSSGQTVGAVEYGKGQATGQPTALPASAILLYEFSVPAGRSAANGGVPISSFVDKRTYTAAAGGIIPVHSLAERNAIAAPYPGMTVWRMDTGLVEVWNTNWLTQGVPTIASVGSAAAFISTPIDGQLLFAQDTRSLYQYDASAAQWKPYFGAPTDYSSSLQWTATSTNPTKGSGTTYTARYTRTSAHMVTYSVMISVGSGFAAGSGSAYFFSLPVPPADSEGYGAMGSCFVSIATGEYVGWVRITTGKAVLYVPQSTSATGVAKGVQVGSTFGIASGSTIHFSITYEV